MPDLLRTWTRGDVLALPDDGNRYELIDGQLLVSPSPHMIHQRAVLELCRCVDPYVRAHRLGVTLLAPADLDLRSDQLVQPDLYVARRLADGRIPLDWSEQGIPMLIAEVTSPSTARYDRGIKRKRFQETRVDEYWILDPDSRSVERWVPDESRPEVLDVVLQWQPLADIDPLVIDLPDYFRDVWGENEP